MDRLDGRGPGLLDQLVRLQHLVLDDRGFHGIDGRQRLDRRRICKERCRRKSTMITAQPPVDKWHALIGEPTITDAIADRLIHHEMLRARFGTHLNAMIRANSAAQC